MTVSRFKATCLSVLERVRKTRQPILITYYGKPLAELAPAPLPPRTANRMGSMAGTGEILGDIVRPMSGDENWDSSRG